MEAKKSTFSLANLSVALPPAPTSTQQQKSTARRPLPISLPHGDAVATTAPISALTKQEEERVKVFVRIRPTHNNETPNALKLKRDGRSLVLHRNGGDVHHHHASDFSFDGVLGPEASQVDVYDIAAKQAVNDVLRGYNATLMAYGMTGAGKTFTLGSIHPDAVGIIPRAFGDIFDFVQADPAHAYTVTFSYLQIYCEQMQDLLSPDSGDNLSIREGAAGVYVPNLKQIEVTSLEDCLQLLQIGARNRNVAFTALNAHSSRSHAVVIATVIRRPLVTPAGRAPRVNVGKLYMVDLAGSERLKKSKSTGQRASEAKAINLSLTTLGMCVSARASGTAAHIPFRDSKLTRLLQESLGGNARTSLVVAVADAAEHAEETLQALQFGSRAMRVVTQAKINECPEFDNCQDGRNGGPGSPLMTSRTRTLVESLLEKESELEAVQAQLKASEQQSRQVVEALKLEHEEMAEKAAGLAAQHAAQQAEQAMLHQAVLDAEERVAYIEAHFQEQKEVLEAQVESLKADALRSAKEADAAHRLLESERAAMEERIEEERAAFELANQKIHAATEALRLEEAAKHAAELAEIREIWEGEKAQLSQQHALALAAAVAEETAKLEFAFKEVENLRQQLEAATAELEVERQASEEKVQQGEATWAHKRKNIIEKAETRKKELKADIAAKEAEAIELRAALQRGHMELLESRNTNAQLKLQFEEKDTEFRNLRSQIVELQKIAQQAQQTAAAAEARAAGAERAAAKLAHSMRRNKRLNEAATVIQRAFRAYRVRALQMQRSEGFAALSEAQMALGSLAQQHAELEARRHSNLALTGQTLVAESLGCLQDLVENLVAEFLLPSKDLKAVQRLRAMAPSSAAKGVGAQSADVGDGRGIGGAPASREYRLQLQQQQQHNNNNYYKQHNPGSDLIGAFRVQDRASRDSSSSAPSSQGVYRGQELPENAQFRKQIGYRL
jgi:kinesin family protein 5